MDVIPLRAELVRGSHGRIPPEPEDWPVFIGPQTDMDGSILDATEVCGKLIQLIRAPA